MLLGLTVPQELLSWRDMYQCVVYQYGTDCFLHALPSSVVSGIDFHHVSVRQSVPLIGLSFVHDQRHYCIVIVLLNLFIVLFDLSFILLSVVIVLLNISTCSISRLPKPAQHATCLACPGVVDISTSMILFYILRSLHENRLMAFSSSGSLLLAHH